MYEVRVYHSIGKRTRIITKRDLKKGSKAIINSLFTTKDRIKIRDCKWDAPGNDTSVSLIPFPESGGFDLR